MAEPYHLTVRFRPYGAGALLDLETDSGAGTSASMELPFGDDLPLVLRALDAAQLGGSGDALRALAQAERDRMRARGLATDGPTAISGLHAQVGRALLRALTADPQALHMVLQARSEARIMGAGLELALRFPREAATLADLPWELLWDDLDREGGLPMLLAQGGHSSCVRYLTLPRPLPPPREPGAVLRILAVAPRARIGPTLYRDQRQALAHALQPASDSGAVQLLQPTEPLTAGRLLELARAHRPDVLSLFCHGAPIDGQGHLLLDAEGGGDEYVAAGRLAGLADTGLRLTLLHACRSDQPGAGLLSGAAGLLSALGIPAVIAMQSYIRVGAAVRLQAVVCRGLAAGQSVQEALAWARAVLYAEERDTASWYVPTLTIASRREEPVRLCAQTEGATTVGAIALAQAGVRYAAPNLVASAQGDAPVAAIAASGLIPFLAQGFGEPAVAELLGALGGGGLAAWLASWAAQQLPEGRLDADQERAAQIALAAALAEQIRQPGGIGDDLATLLGRTAAIPTALDALAAQSEAQAGLLRGLDAGLRDQADLLRGLQADLRRSEQSQGRLAVIVLEAVAGQTAAILKDYESRSRELSAEVQAVLDDVRALRDELRARETLPGARLRTRSVGNDFTGASIDTIGSITGGDSYGGGRVERQEQVFHGPVTINQVAVAQAEPPEGAGGLAPPPALDTLRQEYLRRLSGECSRLSLADADSSDPSRAVVELDQVYTRLEVENRELEASHTLGLRLLSALEVLAEYPRLVLLGDPGSGKSTFINFVGLCFARMALGEPGWRERIRAEWPHGSLLPIRIELRAFTTWLAGRKRPPVGGDAKLFWIWLNQQHDPELGQALRQTAVSGQALFLFDGLDEVVADDDGQILRTTVETIRSLHMAVGESRILVTCRSLDYDQQPMRQLAGWKRQYLIPFSDELRDEFIARWYAVLSRLGRLRNDDPDALREQLRREIAHRPELRRLAGNPLLLTMMAILNTHERGLPEGRATLYARCVELLLHRWRPLRDEMPLRERLDLPGWSDRDLNHLLDRLGMAAHDLGVSSDGERGADLPRRVVVETARAFFEPYGHARDYERAQAFCNYVSRHSNGVLQQSGPDTYRFPHRTFQEYLAARRLIADDDWGDDETEFYRRALRRIAAGPQWRDAVLLAVSQQVMVSNQASPAALLVEELLERSWPYTPSWASDVLLAGEILAEIGQERLTRLPARQTRLWEQAVLALTRLLRPRPDGALLLEAAGRIRAGAVLGLLGDPRPGVCEPAPDWVSIPPGPFLIGSGEHDPDAFSDELPQREVFMPAFRIARYPVTNAQWRRFVEAGGYGDERWWSSAGWEQLRREGRRQPPLWDDGRSRTMNHPVVGISWYEANAYCAWLGAQLDETVRLPSKAEWEKAARGPDGLLYPWGNHWLPHCCNVDLQAGATTPVGCYPDGASPYGLLDMSGNALEWTATQWTDSYLEHDGSELERDAPGLDNEDEAERRYVVRGGAWNLTARSARCAYQLWRRPFSQDKNLGLRLVADV